MFCGLFIFYGLLRLGWMCCFNCFCLLLLNCGLVLRMMIDVFDLVSW